MTTIFYVVGCLGVAGFLCAAVFAGKLLVTVSAGSRILAAVTVTRRSINVLGLDILPIELLRTFESLHVLGFPATEDTGRERLT